jgi:hypothetical protein
MNTIVKTTVKTTKVIRLTREQIDRSNRAFRSKMCDKYIKELIEPSLKDPIFKRNRFTKEIFYYR